MILDNLGANLLILICCALGLIYAVINAYMLSKIKLFHSDRKAVYDKFEDDDEASIETIPDNLTHDVLEVASYIERVIIFSLKSKKTL